MSGRPPSAQAERQLDRLYRSLGAARLSGAFTSIVETGRDSGWDLDRHRRLHEPRYRRALAETDIPSPSPRLLALRGRLLRLLGRDAEAVQALRAAVAAAPSAEAQAWLWEARSGGAFDLAGIDAAIKLEPKQPLWRQWRAAGLMSRRRFAEAETALKELEASAPKDPAAPGLLGCLYLESGRPELALAPLDRALKLAPSLNWALKLRAQARHRLGDRKGSLADCESSLRYDECLGCFSIPLGIYDQRHDSKALEAAAGAEIARDPKSYWAYAYRGDARRSPELNRIQAGLADLERAVELAPRASWAWGYLSRARTSAGDHKGAMTALDRAVALDPKCGWVRVWRGELKRRLGDLKGAGADLAAGAALFPDYEMAFAWGGGVLRRTGRAEAAVESLDTAIRLDPHYAWSYHERMLANRACGRMPEALADATEALRRNPKFSWEDKADRIPAAIAELEAEVKARPDNALAWAWKGELRLRLRDAAGAEADLSKALELQPDLPVARVWRGRLRAEAGRYDEARVDLDRAVRADGKNALALAWRARARQKSGDLKGAWSDITQAAALELSSAWLLCWKGEIALGLKKNDEAARAFTEALELDPSYREALAGRSLATGDLESGVAPLKKEGRHAEIAALCTATLERKPKDKDALRLRAEALRNSGCHDLALQDFAMLAKLDPKDPNALTQRGDAKRHAWDFEGAVSDARAALKLDKRDASAYILLAEGLRSLGRYDEAVTAADAAIANDPGRAWPYVVKAKALRQKGDLAAALAALDRAEKAAEDAYVFLWRGEILRAAGRGKEAVAQLDKGLALHPQCAWGIAVRGEAKRTLGKRADGLKDVLDAVRTDGHCSCAFDYLGAEPANVRGDKALAWVYAWRGGIHRKEERFDAARADLDRAVALDPDCQWALAWRGELRIRQGDAAGALEDLDRSLKLFAGFEQAHIWRGQALFTLSRPAQAIGAFDAALTQDKRSVWALVGRAACLEAMGRNREAAAEMQKAGAIAPGLLAGIGGARG